MIASDDAGIGSAVVVKLLRCGGQAPYLAKGRKSPEMAVSSLGWVEGLGGRCLFLV